MLPSEAFSTIDDRLGRKSLHQSLEIAFTNQPHSAGNRLSGRLQVEQVCKAQATTLSSVNQTRRKPQSRSV
jgi:hypothetical protein